MIFQHFVISLQLKVGLFHMSRLLLRREQSCLMISRAALFLLLQMIMVYCKIYKIVVVYFLYDHSKYSSLLLFYFKINANFAYIKLKPYFQWQGFKDIIKGVYYACFDGQKSQENFKLFVKKQSNVNAPQVCILISTHYPMQ